MSQYYVDIPLSALQTIANTYDYPITSNGVSFPANVTLHSSYDNIVIEPTVYDALNLAQGAYDYANTISGGSAIDNVARILAQSSFNSGNTTLTYAEAGYAKANADGVLAQAAFDAGNTTLTYAQSAYASANNVSPQIQPAFAHANSSYVHSNNTLIYAQSSYGHSNTTLTYAQAGYAKANADGVLTQAAFDAGNTTLTYTQSSFAHANSSYNKANSDGILAQSAFDSGNTTITYSQAAFAKANSAANASVNVASDYTWTGIQQFNNDVIFNGHTFIFGTPLDYNEDVGANGQVLMSDSQGQVFWSNVSSLRSATGGWTAEFKNILNDVLPGGKYSASLEVPTASWDGNDPFKFVVDDRNNIAIGYAAGTGWHTFGGSWTTNSIAIGQNAADTDAESGQGSYAIAIGSNDVGYGQGDYSIAIGHAAGWAGTSPIGQDSIAIGRNAGYNECSAHSIILNASGESLDSVHNGFYVKPIHYYGEPGQYQLGYNPETGEIWYGYAPNQTLNTTDYVQFNSITTDYYYTSNSHYYYMVPTQTSRFNTIEVEQRLTAKEVYDSKGTNVRDFPFSTLSSTYTLTGSDDGALISTNSQITIPSFTFDVGQTVTIFNNSSSNITITGSGVTVYFAGTAQTGNRTLAQKGLATIVCVAGNQFVISGAGLT